MNLRMVLAATAVATMLCLSSVAAFSENKNVKGEVPSAPGDKEVPKGDANLLKDAIKGTPEINEIGCLGFGPRGLLLIGTDKELIAVETGDTTPAKGDFKKFPDLLTQLAAKFGLKDSDVAMRAFAVNPASGNAYFGLDRNDGKGSMVAVAKPDGTVDECSLKDVKYSAVALPLASEEGGAQFNAICWTDTQVIASATSKNAFTAHVMTVPIPIANGASGAVVDCTSFHVTHREWETEAPLSRIAMFEQDKKAYIVAGLMCTPIVKYAVDDIKQGAKLKGASVFNFGAQQDAYDLFTYTKGGKLYLLVNVSGLNDPYVARVDGSLLTEQKLVNEKAPTITVENDEAGTVTIAKSFADKAQMLKGFDHVVLMARLGESKVLVVREANGKRSLEALDLP